MLRWRAFVRVLHFFSPLPPSPSFPFLPFFFVYIAIKFFSMGVIDALTPCIHFLCFSFVRHSGAGWVSESGTGPGGDAHA